MWFLLWKIQVKLLKQIFPIKTFSLQTGELNIILSAVQPAKLLSKKTESTLQQVKLPKGQGTSSLARVGKICIFNVITYTDFRYNSVKKGAGKYV